MQRSHERGMTTLRTPKRMKIAAHSKMSNGVCMWARSLTFPFFIYFPFSPSLSIDSSLKFWVHSSFMFLARKWFLKKFVVSWNFFVPGLHVALECIHQRHTGTHKYSYLNVRMCFVIFWLFQMHFCSLQHNATWNWRGNITTIAIISSKANTKIKWKKH